VTLCTAELIYNSTAFYGDVTSKSRINHQVITFFAREKYKKIKRKGEEKGEAFLLHAAFV